jgi:sulfonate transport system ATP-binding protein
MTTSSASAPFAVDVRDLHKVYGARRVIDGLSLRIAQGEFVALLGKSGCGKTTLLRTLAGLEAVDVGELRTPAAKTVVFQEHRLLPWLNAWRNVALGLRAQDRRTRAERALEEVGLYAHRRAWPVTLSGGEAQRVALARALVREPALLLLDEPFAALDALTRVRMHALVRALVERHKPAVLLVTHDVDEAISLGDRVLVMRDGGIAFQASPAHADNADKAALRKRLLRELEVLSD